MHAPFNMGKFQLDRVCTKHVVLVYHYNLMYDLRRFMRYLVSITQVRKDT
jgi:hypothetical protein